MWKLAQAIGVVLTVGLVGGLLVAPELSLDVLWNGAVPLLPAVFLVSPPLWRNVCPLATLNMLTGRRREERRRSAGAIRHWSAFGILLLLVMVPARRLVFNADGTVLAATVVAVGGLALILGLFFACKSGFCNTICPVAPVERLYGQRPLVRIGNPRCVPCTGCTEAGCPDRTPLTAAEEIVGVVPGARWLVTPFGAFAAAFPGFVLAYFLLGDGSWADAPLVYGSILAGMLTSYAVFALLAVVGGVAREPLILGAAALAISLYYWMGAPAITTAWDLPSSFTAGVRVLALSLVGVWLWKAPRQASVQPAAANAA
jgi:hypothetical protein